ncbi:LysE/ArgO family amino acid transporter [Micrococcus endophyticus]|uniref:LysE/ArgO family amino acid transporter n=1 Tax=Micrococcus endophyticus TaxID=455343 RepID=UPI002002F8BF
MGADDDGARAAGDGSGGVAVKQRVQPRRVVLSAPQTPLPRIVLLALSVSFLNPHAILDTVVMMGTFAQTYGPGKWVYVGGAVAASLVWFTALGWGGTRLAPYMNTPRTWRIVDAAVGVLMLVIAAKVGLTLL